MSESPQEELPASTPWTLNDPDTELALLLRLENVAAAEKFEEVLEAAIDICLTDRTVYEAALKAVESVEDQTADTEQALVRKLGIWGLKAHIDIADHPLTFYTKSFDSLQPPLMHDLQRRPETVPLPPDPGLQNKIEAFGIAITHEAFTCLGEDAEAKAKEFAESDADGQFKVLTWLYDRISAVRDSAPGALDEEDEEAVTDIPDVQLGPVVQVDPQAVSSEREVIDFSNSSLEEVREVVDEMLGIERNPLVDRSPNDDGQYMYHPLRLSPKAIGRYPNIGLRTTCLGVSVLAASFFQRANATYMHAGVMESGLEAARMTQLETILRVGDYIEDNALTANDKAHAAMRNMFKTIDKLRRTDRGHHAVSLVRLQDKTWVVFDPNYNSLDRVNATYGANEINAAYEEMETMGAADRTSSKLVPVLSGALSSLYLGMLDTLNDRPLDDIQKTVDGIMAADDIEQAYKDYILESIADLRWIDTVVDFHMGVLVTSKEKYAESLFDSIVSKYALLEGMTTEQIKERYTSDDGFRKRRIQDAIMLPQYTIMRLLGDYAELVRIGSIHSPNAFLEAGLPEYRIGACVLSDFSMYTGNDIPLSFWVANWPSHVAVEGHLPAVNDDSPQAELGRRMSSIIRSGLLRHFGSYGIIKKFLEQGENSTNGN